MALPDIPLTRGDGTPDSLGAHAGKVLLVVNTASQCGLTPQYAGLEALHKQLGPRGFEVLAFPANDFGSQEPGSDGEIASFCEVNFGASFPIFAKASVVGDDKQPLYAALTKTPDASGKTGRITWNFEKFLVTPDGSVHRFSPKTEPDAPEIVDLITASLPEG